MDSDDAMVRGALEAVQEEANRASLAAIAAIQAEEAAAAAAAEDAQDAADAAAGLAECHICTNVRMLIYLPCDVHHKVCTYCAERLTECPYCRHNLQPPNGH